MRKLIALILLAAIPAACGRAPSDETQPQAQEGQADPEVQAVPTSGN